MVLNGAIGKRPIALSLRSNGITISVGELVEAEVYSYDLSGRLWSAFIDGVSHRRGLDGRILARWREPGQPRRRRWLPQEDARTVERRAYCAVEHLYQAIVAGKSTLTPPLPPEVLLAFERVLAFDEDRSRADVQQYHRVYFPIGILPPDQYMSLVLQMTEGCSFNTCTFCDFYRNRPFHIKTPDELHHHIAGVKALLGDGLSLRQSIFLADANALVAPMNRLLPLLDVVQTAFGVEDRRGLYAFLDGFSGEKKSAADYATLKSHGLRRVYVGLESGSDALLRFLKKPGTAKQAIHTVQSMKAAGLAVGVIVLLGVGGHEHASDHVTATARALNTMGLDRDDIVYLSELVVTDNLPYAKQALDADLTPLSASQCSQQGSDIVNRLDFPDRQHRPRISRYDIRDFVY